MEKGYFTLTDWINKLSADYKSNEFMRASDKKGAFVGKSEAAKGWNELVDKSQELGYTVLNGLKDLAHNVEAMGAEVVVDKNGHATLWSAKGEKVKRSDGTTEIMRATDFLREVGAGADLIVGGFSDILENPLEFDLPDSHGGYTKLYGQEAHDQKAITMFKDQFVATSSSLEKISALNKVFSPHGRMAQYFQKAHSDALNGISTTEQRQNAVWANNALKTAIRKANAGMPVVTNYNKKASQELRGILQGTGTPGRRGVGQGYFSVANLLDSVVRADTSALGRYATAHGSKDSYLSDRNVEAVSNAYMQMIYMYTQAKELADIENDIDALLTTPEYKGLSKSSSLQHIRDFGAKIHSWGFSSNNLPESSFATRILSLVNSADIGTAGGLQSGGDRTPLQLKNDLARSKAAMKKMKAAQENKIIQSRKVLTEFDKLSHEDFPEERLAQDNAMYRGVSASSKGLRTAGERAYQALSDGERKKLLKERYGGNEAAMKAAFGMGTGGSHSGSIFLSEDIVGTLESREPKTLRISAEEWATYLDAAETYLKSDDYKKKYPKRKYTDAAQKEQAMKFAIRDLKGFSDGDFFPDSLRLSGEEGDEQTIAYTLKRPVGVGGSKIFAGSGKYTVSQFLNPKVFEQYAIDNQIDTKNGGPLSFATGYKKLSIRSFGGLAQNYFNSVLQEATPEQLSALAKDPFFKGYFFKRPGEQYVFKGNLFDKFWDKNGASGKAIGKFLGALKKAGIKAPFTYTKEGNLLINETAPYWAPLSMYAGSPYGMNLGGEDVVKFDSFLAGESIRQMLQWAGRNTTLGGIGRGAADKLAQYWLGDAERDAGTHAWRPTFKTGEDGRFVLTNPGLFSGGAKGIRDIERSYNIEAEVRKANEWTQAAIDTQKGGKMPFSLQDLVEGKYNIIGLGEFDDFLKRNFTEEDRKAIDKETMDRIRSNYEGEGARYINALTSVDANGNPVYVNGRLTKESFENSLVGKLFALEKTAGTQSILEMASAKPGSNGFEGRSSFIATAPVSVYNPAVADAEGKILGYNMPTGLQGIEQYYRNMAKLNYDHSYGVNLDELRDEVWNTMMNDALYKTGTSYQLRNPRLNNSMYAQASGVALELMDPETLEKMPEEQRRLFGNTPEEVSKFINAVGYSGLLSDENSARESLKTIFKEDGSLTGLENVYYYLNENLETKEESEKRLKDLYGKKEKVDKKADALIKDILDSVTLGGERFLERSGLAAKNSVELPGLPTYFGRNPLSTSVDTFLANLFVDPSLGRSSDEGKSNKKRGKRNLNRALRVGVGLQSISNADFDGDMLFAKLMLDQGANADIRAATRNFVATNSELIKRVGIVNRMAMSLEDQGGGEQSAKAQNILSTKGGQEVAGILSRINKSSVAPFSLMYQGLFEAAQQTVSSLAGDEFSAGEAASAFATRGIFSSLAQDSISAKKIIERLGKDKMQDGLTPEESAKLFTDVSSLTRKIRNPFYYENRHGMASILDTMIKVGVADEDDMLKGLRTMPTAYSWLYGSLGADKKDFADAKWRESEEGQHMLATLAEFFGTSPENVPLFIDNKLQRLNAKGELEDIGAQEVDKLFKMNKETLLNHMERHNALLQRTTGKNIGQIVSGYAQIVPGRSFASRLRSIENGVDDYGRQIPSTTPAGGGATRPRNLSVTNILSRIFGEVYPNPEGFIENLIDAYYGSTSGNAIRADEIGLDAKTFEDLKGSVIRPQRGQVADAVEQALVTANEILLGGTLPENVTNDFAKGINNIQDLKKFSQALGKGGKAAKDAHTRLMSLLLSSGNGANRSLGLLSLLGSANPDEFLTGWGISKDILNNPEILETLGFDDLEDLQSSFKARAAVWGALYGTEKAPFAIQSALDLGQELFYTTLGAAAAGGGSDESSIPDLMKNVGPGELNLTALNGEGEAAYHGRLDRLVFGTDEQGNDTALTIFDKKITTGTSVSPRNLLQTFAYLRAFKDVRGRIHDDKSLADINNIEGFRAVMESAQKEGSRYGWLAKSQIFDYKEGDEAAEQQAFRLFRYLQGNGAIQAALNMVNPLTGVASTYALDFENGSSLTGNAETDNKIMEYFRQNAPLETWDEGTRKALEGVTGRMADTGKIRQILTADSIDSVSSLYDKLLKAKAEQLNETMKAEDATLSPEDQKAAKNASKNIGEQIVNSLQAQIDNIESYFWDENNKIDPEVRKRGQALFKEAKAAFQSKWAKKEAEGTYGYEAEKKGREIKSRQDAENIYDRELKAQEDVAAAEKKLNSARNENQRILYQSQLEEAQLRLQQATFKRQGFEQKNGGVDTRAQGVAYAAQQERAAATQRQAYLGQGKVAQHGLFGGAASGVGGFLTGIVRSYGFYTIYRKLMEAFSKFIQTAKAMDAVMMNLRIITNGTKEETQQLISSYVSLGRSIGATTQEVAASAIQWQRQGYEAAEVINLVTSSIYLSKLGMIDANAATKDLTSALKGFKLSANESMDVVDKLTAIDLKAAVSAGDVAEGLAQFANLGNLMGVNIDQAAAYVATIADVTQMGGSSAGQAMKMIISRYGNVKAGAFGRMNLDADSEDGSAINDVERVLKKLGISMRKTHSEFKDFDETIGEIADKWNTLDNISQKAIATAFAGTRQQEAFVTLMQNWNKYQELYETSRNSEGTAETKYQAVQESLTAAMNRLTTIIESLVNEQQIGTVLTNLANFGAKIAEALPTLLKFLPQFIIAIQQVRAFKGTSWIQKLGGGIWKRMGLGEDVDGGPFKRGGIRAGRLLFGRVPGGKLSGAATRMITGEGMPKKEGTDTNIEGASASAAASSETISNNLAKAAADSATMVANAEKMVTASEKEKADAEIRVQKAQEEVDAASARVAKAEEELSTSNNLSAQERAYKEGVLTGAKQELATKEKLLSDAKQEVAAKEQVVSNAKQELVVAQEAATREAGAKRLSAMTEEERSQFAQQNLTTEAQRTEFAKIANMSEEERVALAHSETISEDQKKVLAELGAEAELKKKTAAESGAAKGSKAASAFSGAFTALSFALMQSMSAMMSYMNSDTTHKDKWGDTVTSSKRAAAASRTKETVWSMVPIVGSVIGALRGSSQASKIDEIYDEIRHNTKLAQEAVAVLDSVSTSTKTLVSVGDSLNTNDIKEANAAADKILADLYTEENDETRRVIEKYLNMNNNGEQLESIHTLLSKFKNASSQERKNIAKQLEIANLKATQEEKRQAKQEALYNRQQAYYDKVSEYNSQLEEYNELGITFTQEKWATIHGALAGTGATIGGGAVSTGLGLLGAGALSHAGGAAAAFAGPVGWIIAGAGILASALGGYFVGKARKEEEETEAREENEKRFNSMSLQERIDMVTEVINREQSKNAPDYQRLSAATQFLNELESYQDYLYNWAEEQDKMGIETAMAEAKNKNGTYLTELSVGQLKALGATGIYKLLAEQVDANGGLQTAVTSLNNGQPSSSFINLATAYLRSDEEIEAVLSGQNYTLQEAFDTLDETQYFERKILQNFANAMGTTIDDLGEYTKRLGSLKLSELMQSSSELADTITSYEDLLSDIASGTEEQSAWMGKIITQFPELISYMSDTPALMDKIMEKMFQLNEQALYSQWTEYMASTDFYKDVYKDALFGYIEKEYSPELRKEAERIAEKESFTRGEDVQRYLRGFAEGEGNEATEALREAFKNVSAGIKLTADNFETQAKRYTEFQAKIWQKELNNLQQQRDTLQEITKQREYELSLLKARLKLEEAMNEKQRVYRAGVGWVYEADQSKIQEAQDELEELSVEKQIAKVDKQIAYVQQTLDKWANIWAVRDEEAETEWAQSFAKQWLGAESATIKRSQEGALVVDTGLSFTAATAGSFFGLDGVSYGGVTVNSVYGGLARMISILDGVQTDLNSISTVVAEGDQEKREQALSEISGAEQQLEKLNEWKKEGRAVSSAYYNTLIDRYAELVNSAYDQGYFGTGSAAIKMRDEYLNKWKTADGKWKTMEEESRLYVPGNATVATIKGERAPDPGAQERLKGLFDARGDSNVAVFTATDNQGNRFLIKETRDSQGGLKREVYDYTLIGNMINERSLRKIGDLDEFGVIGQEEEVKLQNKNIVVFANSPIITETGSTQFAASRDNPWYLFTPDGTVKAINSGTLSDIMSSHAQEAEYVLYSDKDKKAIYVKDGVAREASLSGNAKWSQAQQYDWGDLFISPEAIMNDDDYAEQFAKDVYSSLAGNRQNAHQRGIFQTTQEESVALINELGTEAIITPQGTITALPSHTGIVPADITANLWTLGELAPSLLHAMGESGSRSMSLAPATGPYTDESFNINTLTMHVSADSSFDADAFVRSIKARVALTKNNIR